MCRDISFNLFCSNIFIPVLRYFFHLEPSSIKSKIWITLKKAFESNVEKGENAGYQHFLLFPQFSTLI